MSFDRRHALLLALAMIVALVVPFTGAAMANHPSNTCLDVEPEDVDRPVGTLHTMTATLRSTSNTLSCEQTPTGDRPAAVNVTSASGVNIDFEITGVNDPDDSESPGTPDLTCTILLGQSSCTVQYQGFVTGDDLIRGWIDHDGTDASQGGNTEADLAEGQNSTTSPGTGCTQSGGATGSTPPEPDCTDVVTVEWTAGPPAALDCDDQNGPDTERETNPSQGGANSNETYTCTVTDADGNPTDNRDVTVFGEVENQVNDPDPEGNEGASYQSPDYRCSTEDTNNDGDEDGTCTITVGQVDGEVGTAEICFWIEEQGSDDYSFASGENPNEGGDAAHCGGESTGEAQQQDGSDVGNDEADQVEKTWEARRASAVDAEPESDTNEPGQNHTVTAHVYDQFGGTFTGSTTVRFEFFEGSPSDTDGNTPETADRSCTTQNSNSCSITYTSQEPGLDRICVFVGNAPAMSGNNTSGTCDGESLVDEDDAPGEADAPEGNDDQDVVQKRWGAAGTAQRLDCDPETATNPTGTSHTVTCTARDSSNTIVSNANIDAEATGANDPDGANSPDSPDFTCTTNSQGQCSFTHGSGGQGSSTQAGMTTYRAWIDSGNDNGPAEADTAEGQNEGTTPGNEGEPDNTDVVTKTWTGDARRIDCEPETATNNTGTTHTVTCTVTDNGGQRVSGEQVTFTEEGVGEIQGSSTDTTDQNGQVTVTTTSSEAGQQTITGTLNDDLDGAEPNEVDECDRAAGDPQGAPAGECSDTVAKTWQTPTEPECSDRVDNDNDGQTDYPDDPGCASATDDDESDSQFPNQEFGGEQGQPVTEGACVGFTTGSVQQNPNGSGLVIVGTNGNDALQGSEAGDLICALDGDDAVQGHGGDDTIHGGAGKDAIEAGDGSDSVFGDDDKDVILGDAGNDDLEGGQGNDNMSGGAGQDELRGQGGWDTLKGNADDDLLVGARGNDILQGGGGNDVGRAGAGDDVLKGYRGNDELRGGGGEDLIRGSAGRDRLFGNAGNDVINGGPGKDRCRGGRGRDILRNC